LRGFHWLLLAILCVLASLLVPGIAWASAAAGAGTRVRAFDTADLVGIGGEHSPSPGLHRGSEPTYDQLASDSLLAARGGANSFSSLKRALGPAGEGRQWHHVVEQTQVGKFGSQAIHNADNVVSIPTDIHRKISGFYSSKPDFAGGQTVRQWLSGQSFEQQRAFGQQVLRVFGVGQ
jgi:hypothetical protein